ncbi:MAG: MMPL family transporter, partial [Halobacteriales archaeon]
EKLDYLNRNFSTGRENATTAQILVSGDDVLSKQSLLAILAYEQRLRDNEPINETLTGDRQVVSVANVVATAAIVEEEVRELQALSAEFERKQAALSENRTALEQRAETVNATARDLQAALTVLRQDPSASVRTQWEAVVTNTSVDLDETDYETFRRAARQIRNATTEPEVREAYRLGTEGVLREEYEALQQRRIELQQAGAELQTLGEELQRQQAAFENASDPTLQEQIDKLESMNASAVEQTVATVLDADSESPALALMPTDYEPGETEASATMIVVTQESSTTSAAAGAASKQIEDAQLAMQDIDEPGGLSFAVFGAGIITNEIDASMQDSLAIVAPLALLFVLVALAIGYRDLLDILLGLFGIAVVLVWTFGVMGWADVAFNQIFVAVPVLLIGLSIDYAIHIFMRHREERLALDADDGADADGPRRSMAVALGGVGIALVWVTATTVIGFLSNLISPVPPIREFGVVSSAGIVAALLVFGVLVPSLKVELDELLERYGIDRRKRAFGTGGGRFSRVLSVGSTAARTAPLVLLFLVLLVTAAGAYGGSQVDTSFSESDFLAEDPPGWMDRLPGPMQPGDYYAKANLNLVNEKFVREDSQAQVLIEGAVTDDDVLERVADAEQKAATRPVTQNLSTGEASLTTPITVMENVAARNESFNRTFHAADTDVDGVPDRNLTGVYDELYRVAPDEAGSVVYRDGDEYRALRIVVAIEGGAGGEEVQSQMEAVTAAVDGNGLTATATGRVILNKIVQDELLRTVLESLLVSLVSVVLFLALVYRVTKGTATLGVVTLLPVVLSVAWILGTMYAVGVSFNVLTGMITSLTIGLGVAYSIHLSERYTQELERHGSVWTAMERATTGTGGALLGSAATTVGGFGVLVFAILPPLQQFGFITGLTIVYALLASVVVLPSLLVVWTRYAGPQGAREEVADHGLSVLFRDRGDGEKADGTDAPDEGDAGGGDGPTPGGEAGPTPGDAGPEPKPTAERSVGFDQVHPGGTIDVSVTVSGVAGRVVVSEAFDGTVEEVVDVEPEPVEVVVDEGTLQV